MLGYKFKNPSEVSTFTKAYADDLTLLTCNAEDNQTALNLINSWLMWTQTMKEMCRFGFESISQRQPQ